MSVFYVIQIKTCYLYPQRTAEMNCRKCSCPKIFLSSDSCQKFVFLASKISRSWSVVVSIIHLVAGWCCQSWTPFLCLRNVVLKIDPCRPPVWLQVATGSQCFVQVSPAKRSCLVSDSWCCNFWRILILWAAIHKGSFFNACNHATTY